MVKTKDRYASQSYPASKIKAEVKTQADKPHYHSTKQSDDYFTANIIGQDVTNRRDNKVIGSVDELMINQDGQISAVIVSTGGILGMGEKDLAIAWDQIDRKVVDENVTLSVDFTENNLEEAPSLARN